MGVKDRRARQKTFLRQQILDAARELLVRDGYEKLSMRRVAQRIDYSPTAIYLHFKDKQELVSSLCDETFARLVRELETLPDEFPDPLARLRKGMERYISFGLKHPDHYLPTFVLPLPADPRAAIGTKVDRVALAGCGEPNLLWSTDGKSLLALCTPGGGKPGWIVRIAPDTLKTSNQPAGETGRLLGWRDGALVVEGGGGVSILSSDGSLRLLFKPAEAEFVLAWLRGPGEALFVEGNEDSGYPTVLRLVGPNPASSRPWLHDFGRMNGFNFIPDGSWTMFVRVLGGDREGGDAYLVQTGSEQATKVLPATAERSYSSPVVRPPARR